MVYVSSHYKHLISFCFYLFFLNRHSSVTLDRNARNIKDKRKVEAETLSLKRCSHGKGGGGGVLLTGAGWGKGKSFINRLKSNIFSPFLYIYIFKQTTFASYLTKKKRKKGWEWKSGVENKRPLLYTKSVVLRANLLPEGARGTPEWERERERVGCSSK